VNGKRAKSPEKVSKRNFLEESNPISPGTFFQVTNSGKSILTEEKVWAL